MYAPMPNELKNFAPGSSRNDSSAMPEDQDPGKIERIIVLNAGDVSRFERIVNPVPVVPVQVECDTCRARDDDLDSGELELVSEV